MKNIDDDSNFRTYIMKEENYLSFSDEIILYTGLNTNQEEILKTYINKNSSLLVFHLASVFLLILLT